MMRKLLQRFHGSYDAVLVLLIVAVAGVLIYALYRATGGGGGAAVSIVAAFDDVTGIKERSKVLFKGMPVGSVRNLKYDKETDRILVRLDIQQAGDIPANVQPFLESSLFGEAHIALKTAKDEPVSGQLASVAGDASRDISKLHRLEGTRLSKADTLLPGFDEAKQRVAVQAEELYGITKNAVTTFHQEMMNKVSGPVDECIAEMKRIIKGEGEADPGLKAELEGLVADLEGHSNSLNVLFNGKPDGSAQGLIRMVDSMGGDWNLLVTEMMEGKDEAIGQLEQVSKSLDKAGNAIARSESEVKKLGKASDKLGEASDSVKTFMEVMKVKPNSLVWGMNGKQKEMLNQPRGSTATRGTPVGGKR